jgi:hypothetical protein
LENIRSVILAKASTVEVLAPLALEVDRGRIEKDYTQIREEISVFVKEHLFDQIFVSARAGFACRILFGNEFA